MGDADDLRLAGRGDVERRRTPCLDLPQRSRVHLPRCSVECRRNVKRFRGGLVFKAHRRFDHSTLGSSVIKKKKRKQQITSPLGSAERATNPQYGRESSFQLT